MRQYVTSRCIGTMVLALAIAAGPLAHAASLSIVTVASTVPSNGDLNPYGVAMVPGVNWKAGSRPHPGKQFQQ